MKAWPFAMFWLLGLIWGSSFIYMKMASEHITAMQIVVLRLAFGLVPIAAYAAYKKAFKRAHLRHAIHFVFMAVVGTIGYYYGFAKGSSLLLSGVAGALSGMTAILTFILAWIFLREGEATGFKALGVAIGFTGVLLIARPFSADISTTNIEGVFYNIAGSLAIGAAFVYAKRFVLPLNIPASAVITYQFGISLVILCLFADFTGIGAIWSDPVAAAGLAVGLGILGTGLGFILYYYITDTLGVVTASSVGYVPPVIALVIGAVLVGEPIELWEYLGAALILLGVFMLNARQRS